MKKSNKNYFVQEEVLDNKKIVESTIVELHSKNKDDVPKYLDEIKNEKNNIKKEATYDNDFLKYML